MAFDDINAYDQAPPPYEPLYVHVYYKYGDWYHANHGIDITSVFFLPVNRDFPGHPQSVSL